MSICETCAGNGWLYSDSGPAPRTLDCHDCDGVGEWEDEDERPVYATSERRAAA